MPNSGIFIICLLRWANPNHKGQGIGDEPISIERFKKADLNVLKGDTPVIGVVRDKPGVLTDAVRWHPNVRTIVVTVENREEVLRELLEKKDEARTQI